MIGANGAGAAVVVHANDFEPLLARDIACFADLGDFDPHAAVGHLVFEVNAQTDPAQRLPRSVVRACDFPQQHPVVPELGEGVEVHGDLVREQIHHVLRVEVAAAVNDRPDVPALIAITASPHVLA